MFKKFEAFMNKHVTPLAQRMDKQPHLNAIKKSMVAMTPILIIGSLCLVPEAIPNMIGEKNVVSQFIINNLDNFYIPYYVTLGMMSVYVCACITYFLGNHYKLYVPGCMVLGIVGYFTLIFAKLKDGGLNMSFFGPKGLFMAMIAGIISVELYRWCKKRNFTIRMPDNVPDFVSRSFELIPTSVIIVGVFCAIRFISLAVFDVLPPEVLTQFLKPLVGSMDNPFMFVFVCFLSCLLFFFGIHPSVLSAITTPIATQFLTENIEAMQAGTPLPHFYTGGMVSAFMNFTGTGVTFGLVFWFLFSKNKAYRSVGRVSLVPALFGINEPILFGGPIVLNPTFFLPYVIGGTILGTFPAFLMWAGVLGKPWFNPPYVGVFLEGFLVCGDWLTIVVNGAQMIGSILIWYPFFKLYEKQNTVSEEPSTNSAISAEDAALLDDLDLDF